MLIIRQGTGTSVKPAIIAVVAKICKKLGPDNIFRRKLPLRESAVTKTVDTPNSIDKKSPAQHVAYHVAIALYFIASLAVVGMMGYVVAPIFKICTFISERKRNPKQTS